MNRKIIITILTAAVLLSCAGCFRISAEELYALPQLSDEYVDLQKKINAILSQGAEYSPPMGGENRQAVQLIDLTGDGQSEVAAFFSAAGELPLKIYIFSRTPEGGFSADAVLEGVGTGFDSVRYADMDNDGVPEIIVGWHMSEALRHLTLYRRNRYGYLSVAETDYSAMTVDDLNGDGAEEIITLLLGTDDNAGEAEMISLNAEGAVLRSKTGLTAGITEVRHIASGLLSDGTPALFVDGFLPRNLIVTDVFTAAGGALQNTVYAAPPGSVFFDTRRSVYPSAVYSADIHTPEDGICEIPLYSELPVYGNMKSVYYSIDWFAMDSKGAARAVLHTYHDFTDGWYLVIPEDWIGKYTVRRENNPLVTGEHVLVFSYTADAGGGDFLKIYSLTGDSREDRARLKNRFRLLDYGMSIYAAEIIDTEGFPVPPTEEQVRANFNKITAEWTNGL